VSDTGEYPVYWAFKEIPQNHRQQSNNHFTHKGPNVTIYPTG
jgi:hypothetical protein